jgi:peptide/nickel transport system permease protein
VIFQLILRRLGFVVLVLLGISLFTFLLSHIVPADPVRLYAGPRASAASVALIRHQYGFDLPVWQQYVRYLGDLLHGDFSYSLTSHRSVSADLYNFLPATIELTLAALVMVLAVGIPVGVLSAIWPGSIMDGPGRTFSIPVRNGGR